MARIPAGFRLSATIAVTEVRTQLKPNDTAVSERFALARPLLASPRSKSGKNTSTTAAAAINARMGATFPNNAFEVICLVPSSVWSVLESCGRECGVGGFEQSRAFLEAVLIAGVERDDARDHDRKTARFRALIFFIL